MTNIRSSNTFYIDSTSPTLAVKNIKLLYLVVGANAANAILILKDVTTGATKLEIRQGTDETTQQYSFEDNPIVFPNGIDPTTVTNCSATCVIEETRG